MGNEQKKYYTGPDKINYAADPVMEYMSPKEIEKRIMNLKKEIDKSAKNLDFETAILLRDELYSLEKKLQK